MVCNTDFSEFVSDSLNRIQICIKICILFGCLSLSAQKHEKLTFWTKNPIKWIFFANLWIFTFFSLFRVHCFKIAASFRKIVPKWYSGVQVGTYYHNFVYKCDIKAPIGWNVENKSHVHFFLRNPPLWGGHSTLKWKSGRI